MLKRLIVVLAIIASAGLLLPVASYAQETTQTCTTVTQYGGSVGYICGAATHVPVNTGIGDNLALIGSLVILSSGFLLFLSRKAQKATFNGKI